MTSRLNLPAETKIKEILRLNDSRLPSFPQAAAKLIDASHNETASLQDLGRIMETDPGLSVQLLKIVNSAAYGLARKITTLSEAVVYLGLDEIRKQALGMTLCRHLFKNDRTASFDMLFFWRHSLSVGVLSLEIARAVRYPDPEEAYVAGLLHDVGKIFLVLGGRTDYGEFIQGLSSDTELVIEAERSTVGAGHDEVGAWFCDLWKLPEKLTAVARFHHQTFDHQDLSDSEKKLIAIVSLANFLCWTQGVGSFDFFHLPVLAPEVADLIDLDQVAIVDAILAMNREMETISAYYDFVFPSPGQLQKNLLRTNLNLSRINTRYFFQEDTFGRSASKDRKSSRMKELKLEFGKPLARARNVKEVLDIVMYQVGRIFEPRHWSILLKNPKSGDLVFSVVVGENKEKLQGVKLSKGEGIAGYIMETGQSLVIEDVSKDNRFSRGVDKHTGFRTRSIIGAPLKTEGRIFGVIELINRIGETHFDEKDLTFLSSIAEYAAIAIERSYYMEALTRLATNDALTGLKNRWRFEQDLGNRHDFKIRYGSIFSMLIITVGGLNRLLHAQGQAACDNAVKALARIIDMNKRRNDSLYRYNETLFLMLLPLTYSEVSESIRGRIKDVIQKSLKQIQPPYLEIKLRSHTLSIGEIEDLIPLLGKSVVPSGKPEESAHIADIQENLQPLVEAETRKAADAVDQKKKFGKAVSLGGHYLHPKSRRLVQIRVVRISLTAIGFRIPESETLNPQDFLQIQFILNDQKRSVIKRRGFVRELDGDYVHADFYNPPPYAKNLGFYMLS